VLSRAMRDTAPVDVAGAAATAAVDAALANARAAGAGRVRP